ncbi:transcription factor FER-LIKE IRON DEFICIENCY-INDUCED TRANSCRIPTION FACTOR-like [Humulus lupulus]|uniref:transcription factor FER-LIKE IRON DEFICIENCY-INDUCED TRANSCRIPTION FACTOR-like n=1 Tax=Humulus lupulus TaxID=3486 RepID=UPI002B41568E|nr:transcription factor FER-LIKE IRON DEFICIENCY-INDUCED TRANSCRIPTION FACTOR-like [Humulus lupulus]
MLSYSPSPNLIMPNFNKGLELHDFFDCTHNIISEDQFENLLRGAETDQYPFVNFDHCGLINGFIDDHHDPIMGPGDHAFGFNGISNTTTITGPIIDDPNISLFMNSNLALPSFDHEEIKGDGDQNRDHYEYNNDQDVEDDDENDRQESSEANTGTSANLAKKTKVKGGDKSKTLISERRRRGRMKEKLYALRSLVPFITKMDKASIVGDAVVYVEDLKMQAKKLKDEIASLETSLLGSQRYQKPSINSNPTQIQSFHPKNTNQLIFKKIAQMDMFQVEERGFYMRLVCNKVEGVAASLYKVVESLTSFNVQTSNLASKVDGFELTVTLRVKETVQEMHLPNLKLWVVGALLNHGFELKSPFSP